MNVDPLLTIFYICIEIIPTIKKGLDWEFTDAPSTTDGDTVLQTCCCIFFPPHISACYLLQQLHCLEWQRARERARTHASVNWLLFKLIVEPSEAMTQTQEWDSLTCCLRICGLTLLPGVETKIPMFPVKRLKSTFKRTQNSSSDDTKSEVLSALPPVTEASILHWFLYIKLLSSSHWSLFLLHSFNWTVSADSHFALI